MKFLFISSLKFKLIIKVEIELIINRPYTTNIRGRKKLVLILSESRDTVYFLREPFVTAWLVPVPPLISYRECLDRLAYFSLKLNRKSFVDFEEFFKSR